MSDEKLSREQMLAMIDLIDEQDRRARLKKDTYLPNHGQQPVHACDKPIRAVFSGNGAGKTCMLVNEALWAAQGYNPILDSYTPVPAKVIVVLDGPEKINDKWLPEIQKWYNIDVDKQCVKEGKPFYSRINFPNGSYIKFMFHEQKEMKFESIEVDFVGFDEPPPRHVYIGLMRGGRELGSDPKFLMVGTPLAAPWLRIELYEPWLNGELEDTECFRFDSDVNKENLNWAFQEKWFSKLTEKELRIRRRGEFFDLEGLALANLWDREVHIVPDHEIKWDRNWPCIIAIDPHGAKPHHAVLIGADKDNKLMILRELKEKCTPRAFAPYIKDWMNEFRVIDITYDNWGNGEGTGMEGFKTFGQIMSEEGVRMTTTSFDEKSDEAFILRLQDSLEIPDAPDNLGCKVPKLRVSSRCSGCIMDFENVQWVKMRHIDTYKPKLDIENKDFLAAVKYGLARNLHSRKGKDKAYYRTKPMYNHTTRTQRKVQDEAQSGRGNGVLRLRPRRKRRR